MSFSNTDAEFKRLTAELRAFEREAAQSASQVAMALIDALMARTPVWSGETVRNYAIGVGSRPTGSKSAIGGVDPGDTNSMPLGPEPRRARNEAAARDDARAALVPDKLVDYTITNTVAASKWDIIDNGSAPTPDRARYAGGISLLAQQAVRSQFRGVVS